MFKTALNLFGDSELEAALKYYLDYPSKLKRNLTYVQPSGGWRAAGRRLASPCLY